MSTRVLVLLVILARNVKPTSMNVLPILVKTVVPASIQSTASLAPVLNKSLVLCVKPISMNALPVLAKMAAPAKTVTIRSFVNVLLNGLAFCALQ
jgi:hypothetical protein